MKRRTEELLTLFDKAMETESEGIKFYEEAAAKSQDAKARDIFQMLARAEHNHYSFIEDAKESVGKIYSHDWKGNFISDIAKEIEAIGRQYIPALKTETISANALEAINMGIKLEQDSIAFYSYAKTRVTEPAVFNMYNLLLTAETTHLLFLDLAKGDYMPGGKYA